MKTYRFTATLMRQPGKGGMYYVLFPHEVEKEFGTKGSVRVLGALNNIVIDRALIPRGDGTHYILINTELRRKAGLREGNTVIIAIKQNENPDILTIPEELIEGFEMEPEARKIFDQHTKGFQRSIIYWINTAKRTETRAQRVGEMLQRLISGYYK